MKNLKVILITILSIFLCGLVAVFLRSNNTEVKQEVNQKVNQKIYSQSSVGEDLVYFNDKVNEESRELTRKSIALATHKCILIVNQIKFANKISFEKEISRIDSIYTVLELKRNNLSKADYILHTSYKDTVYVDLGNFHYIDSIKCIRYSQMLSRVPHIDTLEVKTEDQRKRIEDQRKKELEKLNKSCK